MPRPQNKQDLELLSEKNFSDLFELINSLSEKDQEVDFSFEDRDKNIRDVLVHLYEWHKLLLHWIEKNTKGEQVPFLPEPYTWKTYGEMNIKFWEQHQKTPYKDAIIMLKESHNQVMKCIQIFSDEELFTKKYYSWTGTTSLWSYCVSATSSHYDWAIKKIKKHKKSL